MFGQADAGQDIAGVDGEDFLARAAGIEADQEGGETAHDMGVAIGPEGEGVAILAGDQPDLAHTTLDLVDVGALGLRHVRQGFSHVDEIAIALLPIVQEVELVDEVVDLGLDVLCRHVSAEVVRATRRGKPPMRFAVSCSGSAGV